MIDRDTAARLGITVSQIDNTLYDAFGQRQVSTIYVARNQYHVIMEVAPQYWQNPETLKDVYVSTSGGSVGGSQATNAVAGTIVAPRQSIAPHSANAQAARNPATNSIGATGKGAASTGSAVSTSQETMVPLSAVAQLQARAATPLAVNHQGLFVATTISFNLPPGGSLSDAVARHRRRHEPDRRARHHPRQLPGHGQGVPGFARQPAVPDPGGAGRRSISCSACSTRATSIR